MSPFEHERNKKSKLKCVSEHIASARSIAVLSIIMLLLGASYIFKTNAVSGQGYAIKELERSARALQEETQKIELDLASRTASKQLRSRAEALGFTSSRVVKYITTAPTVVARK